QSTAYEFFTWLEFRRVLFRSDQQNGLELRVRDTGGYVDISGLGAGSSFTPKYSGTYRIKANVIFGAGRIVPEPGYATAMATEEEMGKASHRERNQSAKALEGV